MSSVNAQESLYKQNGKLYILILLSGFAWPFFLANCADVEEKGAFPLVDALCRRAFRQFAATDLWAYSGIWKTLASDAMIGEVCIVL
jgi:hypothetical protein